MLEGDLKQRKCQSYHLILQTSIMTEQGERKCKPEKYYNQDCSDKERLPQQMIESKARGEMHIRHLKAKYIRKRLVGSATIISSIQNRYCKE